MNILEIIKKAPKDHVYYCTVFGNCNCNYSGSDNDKYPIRCDILSESGGITLSFLITKDGKYVDDTPYAECVLFPSCDNRDWKAFERELDGVKDNDSRFNPPAYGTDSYKDGVFEDVEEVLSTDIDWQEVRIKAAISALQGFASNSHKRCVDASTKDLAAWSVGAADALIAELKKGGE